LATTQNLFDKAIKVSKLTKIDFLSADATTARAIFPGFSSWRRLPLEASLLPKFAELVMCPYLDQRDLSLANILILLCLFVSQLRSG